MMESLFSLDKLVVFVVIALPGFISLRIWSLISPSEKFKVSDKFFELVLFSFLNYLVTFPIILLAVDKGTNKVYSWLGLLLTGLIFPIFWPILRTGF